LNLTNSAGLAASSSANLTLAGSGAGNITGPLSLGSGNLTVSGGTWTVAPSNNFSGLTTLNSGGVLRITGGQSLGPVPGSFNAGEVTFSTGGTLDAATNITLNDGNIGITLSASSTIAVDSGATFNISNQITSSSGVNLTKSSPGTLVLSGPTTLNSELYVDTGQTSTGNDGTLVIANNAAIASLLALAGTPVIQIRNENAASSTLGLDGTLGSITISPDISLAGRNNTVAAIDNVAGNNTISGNITIDAGGGIYALQSDSGTLTLSASLPYATPTNSLRTFTFMGAGNIAVPGTIQNGSSTGTSNIWINVIKTGAGLLSLPAANTYSGFTTVSNGVLLLNGGTIGNGPVTVMGGLLVGNGTITGPVTVQSAGAIEAGATNSIGTLTLSGTLALSGNTLVKINKAGPGNDQFTGQTSVTYGGTLTVTNLAGTLTTSDTFTLFSPGASASNFAGIVGSPGAGLKYTFTNGVLGVAVGIKPTPHFTSVSVSGTTLTISGTNGAGGGQYVLLGSTNVALPLIQWTPLLTNMFDGSGNFNLSTNIVNPALPQEFYILSQ
jgi:autotransporter-associated beta strand protein